LIFIKINITVSVIKGSQDWYFGRFQYGPIQLNVQTKKVEIIELNALSNQENI